MPQQGSVEQYIDAETPALHMMRPLPAQEPAGCPCHMSLRPQRRIQAQVEQAYSKEDEHRHEDEHSPDYA